MLLGALHGELSNSLDLSAMLLPPCSVWPCPSASRPRKHAGFCQYRLKCLARVGVRAGRHVLRRAGGDNLTPAGAAFRAKIDDPVRGLDDVKVVLDDDDGVARLHEAVQHLQELLDVVEVQACGRLIENVERLSGALAAQFARELDSLGLAAGQRRRRLAELDVVQPHVVEGLQHAADARHIGEMLQRFLHVHFQHITNVLALEANLERFAVEPPPLTDRASHPNVG